MANYRSITIPMPGSYGINTQDEIQLDEAKRFGSLISNGVIDTSGKLTARKDFNLLTSGFTGNVEQVYTHRLSAGTEAILSAAIGKIYSGTTTLTQRYSFTAGYQVVDVGGAKTGATATGLANSAEVYGFTCSINGAAATQVSVTGSAAQTYTTLLAEINTDLGAGATAALVAGNLRITSGSNGVGSTIAITATPGTASNNLLTTLTNYVAVRTANAGGTTANKPQFASLNSRIYFAQAGKPLTCLLETDYSEEAIVAQPWTSSPNVLIAADGRLWAADDAAGSESYTVWWSDLLDGKAWTGGDAGEIDLRNAFPAGMDSIVALAMVSTRLIIFCRNCILLYTLPADHDPGSMALTDVVQNVGCVARDSVTVTEEGVYFLAADGYYRTQRLANITNLLTVTKVSKLYSDDVVAARAAETASLIASGYFPKEGWLALSFPTSNKTFLSHTKRIVPGEGLEVPAVTTWTNTSMPFRSFCFDKDDVWYCGGTNGVYKYNSYTADGANSTYTFDFYTQWTAFEPARESSLKHLKNVQLTLNASSAQAGTVRWRTDYKEGTTNTAAFTCSAAEFAENPGIGEVSVPIGRSCNVVKAGWTITVTQAVKAYAMKIWASAGAGKKRG